MDAEPRSEEPDGDDGSRARLSKRAVTDRALKLADADGLDTLTIRKLAQDLGVTPMALYWHFRSKEDLLEGVAERVWDEIDVNVDPAAPWPDQLAGILKSLVSVLRAHPSAPRSRSGSCAARVSIRGTPARSPAARCGPGSRWS